MGKATVHNIIKETAQVIWDTLQPIHMPPPDQKLLKKVALDFYNIWNFPHCIGAIDGKHIRIKSPCNSGSVFFNYKKFFSIVLQAVVDARYRFLMIDVGGYGQQSDGGTFRVSELYYIMEQGQFPIPQPDELPGSSITVPYFLIGDAAYPIMENSIKPYPGKTLEPDKTTFNYRLSRARRTVECAFGILAAKWRILHK